MSSAAAQDASVVDALAGVLAAEDARRYDGPLLSGAARHPSPQVRRRAALAIGRIGDRSGTPTVIELLADPDSSVQRDAAFALGLLRDPSALEELRDYVLLAPPATQHAAHLEAVTAIAKVGGEGAESFFREFLGRWVGQAGTTTPPPTVDRAVQDAWRLGGGAPVDQLVEFTVSPLSQTRLGAVYSLARLRAPAASDVLLTAADHVDPEIRALAARALTADYADSAGIERSALATRVRRLTADSAAHVRINALRAIGSYRDPGLVAAVRDRLTDPDANVRVQALQALAELGGPEAGRIFREQIGRQPFAVRRQALIGLTRTDGERALDLIQHWLTEPDWMFRHAGSEALGYVAADTVVPWLLHMTRDPDARVAAVAMTSLLAVAPDQASERARELLIHDDPAVRAIAADRIRSAPDTALIDLLVQSYRLAQRDPIPDARIAIVSALGRIAELGLPERVAVEQRFLARVSRPDDYLVRRAAQDRFPLAADRWGTTTPINTRKSLDDYRDIVRRFVLPADRGVLPEIVIETDRGRIEIQLFAGDAPLTVHALLELVDRRFFDGSIWHRVVPNFVIQDGDPRGDGVGGPGFALRDEINPRRYERGTMGMALSGPDTGGSQFFITHSPQPHLDGGYTVVGQVRSGLAAVDLITQGDRIRRIRRP